MEIMEIIALGAFVTLIVAWVALPLRGPAAEVETISERQAA